MHQKDMDYAGFWIRSGAAFVDYLLIMLIALPLLAHIHGWSIINTEPTGLIAVSAEIAISWFLPAAAVIIFWITSQATPGKMAVSVKIVDAVTGNAPSPRQMVRRYFAYYLAVMPLGLGILWILLDKRKQGWHDKMAGTVVVRQARTHLVQRVQPPVKGKIAGQPLPR
jgi:uncharacterized RDD family membrane protein YckC